MTIHIGETIKKLIKKNGLKVRYVSDFLNVSESTLYDIYRRPTIDIDKLVRFSQLLNQNLFVFYFDEEPIKSMFGKEEQALQKQIIELENELGLKNEKLKDLADIIDAQKKIISFYETKSERSKGIKKKI